MTQSAITYRGGRIFDGESLHDDLTARFENGTLVALGDDVSGDVIDLDGDILAPGYVDLQVNGGDGVMLGDDPSVETLRRMAEAHRSLGVVRLLPTLITDTLEKTRATIDATLAAIQNGVTGIAGLHLEGPHLSVARKGAHDAELIRPMEPADLDLLLDAAQRLPVLKVTVAPENVTEAQVRTLAAAGVVVSLGHTDADFDTCARYFAAEATCTTHLFNAMSQLTNREPGLVGAVLAHGSVSAGLIADAVHVHPESIRAAWDAKRGPGKIFLVSDAMAVAGSEVTAFELGGRTIKRQNGTLTLADGTLAGADLDLTTAVRIMVNEVGIPLAQALAAATSVPADLCEIVGGRLVPGHTAINDILRITPDLTGWHLLDGAT